MRLYRERWLCLTGLGGAILKIDLYPFGLCKVEPINGDEWEMELRKALFPVSRHEYPFLRTRLFGDWWIAKGLHWGTSNKSVWAVILSGRRWFMFRNAADYAEYLLKKKPKHRGPYLDLDLRTGKITKHE